MPKGSIHRAISKKRTGEEYAELHAWTDQKRGVNHRKVNHYYTTKLREYVYDNFGGSEAVSEWLFHIALDNLDTYISNEWHQQEADWNFIKFGFTEDGFIHCEEEELSEEEMEEEFED